MSSKAQLHEKPIIKPFIQNTLNPSELEKLGGHFKTGWTVRYNTVQVAVSKPRGTTAAVASGPK